jgi:hypothetical protein
VEQQLQVDLSRFINFDFPPSYHRKWRLVDSHDHRYWHSSGMVLLSTPPAKSFIFRARINDGAVPQMISRAQQLLSFKELRDEDEPAPPAEVFAKLASMLRRVNGSMKFAMPLGQIASFYGELGVTWRTADGVVKLIVAPGKDPAIVRGKHADPVGSFTTEPASDSNLAMYLDAISAASRPESPSISLDSELAEIWPFPGLTLQQI